MKQLICVSYSTHRHTKSKKYTDTSCIRVSSYKNSKTA